MTALPILVIMEMFLAMGVVIITLLVGGVWEALSLPIPSAFPTQYQLIHHGSLGFMILIFAEALVFFIGAAIAGDGDDGYANF